MVSQTSPDRLWMLAHLCRRWEGPFVLAVFVQEGKFTEVCCVHVWAGVYIHVDIWTDRSALPSFYHPTTAH